MTYTPSNLYEQAADIIWHSLIGTLEDQFGEPIRRAFTNALEMPTGKDYHRVIEVIVAVLEWYEAHGLPRKALLLSIPYGSSYDLDERLRLAAEVVEAQRILWIRKGTGISAELVDQEVAYV